jgi:DNA repair photolyase
MEYRVKEIQCRCALHHHNSRWLPFKYDINVYRGCAHRCIYCYALYSHEYIQGGSFYNEIYAKVNIADALKRELPKFSREQVNLGGVTDSYQPAERDYRLMPPVLELLARFKVPVSICTKSPLILRDIELLKSVNEAGGLMSAFTITTMDNTAARLLEPGAPPPHERMAAIKEIKKQGIICGVHLMPIIPHINSSEHSIDALMGAAKDAGADYVLTGALNRKNSTFFESVRQSFPGDYGSIRELYADKKAYKEYREDLDEIIARVRKRYRMPAYASIPRRREAVQMSFL